MSTIKLKDLLAENMRRFGTKNLKEASYTANGSIAAEAMVER